MIHNLPYFWTEKKTPKCFDVFHFRATLDATWSMSNLRKNYGKNFHFHFLKIWYGVTYL